MILDVDMGNSYIKWRTRRCDGHLSPIERVAYSSDYASVFAGMSLSPKAVYASCVVPSVRQAFNQWCVNRWQLEPCYAQVSKACFNVTNAYDKVSQMGVDRWLALLAAHNKYQRACLVIDAGTALTVDLLLDSGDHLGGYIAPGEHVMRNALFQKTEITDVKRMEIEQIQSNHEIKPGASTQAAVSSGLFGMQLGLVVTALDCLMAAGGRKPYLIFTGGGGLQLLSLVEKHLLSAWGGFYLNEGVQVAPFEPALVLDGLPLAIDC